MKKYNWRIEDILDISYKKYCLGILKKWIELSSLPIIGAFIYLVIFADLFSYLKNGMILFFITVVFYYLSSMVIPKLIFLFFLRFNSHFLKTFYLKEFKNRLIQIVKIDKFSVKEIESYFIEKMIKLDKIDRNYFREKLIIIKKTSI